MRTTGDSGMVIKMGTGAISWSSRLQSVVALSTTEAEFISAVSAGQEILWLRHLFQELGYPIKGPSTLYIDNMSALSVARNPEHHGRMKHLDLKFFWLRQAVQDSKLRLEYIPTEFMLADLLTKPLERVKVQEHRKRMGVLL